MIFQGLKVSRDGFANVAKRFLARLALGPNTRQVRHRDNEPAFLGVLQDDFELAWALHDRIMRRRGRRPQVSRRQADALTRRYLQVSLAWRLRRPVETLCSTSATLRLRPRRNDDRSVLHLGRVYQQDEAHLERFRRAATLRSVASTYGLS